MNNEDNSNIPHSPEAEKAILSSLFQGDISVITELKSRLTDDHFYLPHHKSIYGILLSMLSDNKPMDITVATEYAKSLNILDKIGGAHELMQVLMPLCIHQHYQEYLNILETKRSLRRLYNHFSEGAVKVLQHNTNPLEVASDTVLLCQDILSSKEAKGKTMEEYLDEWEESWTQTYHGDRPSCYPSRWSKFNDKCYGIRPGYTVISGRRASGKSVFGYNMIVDYCVEGGHAGLIKNYEMPVCMTINRLLSDIGGIPGQYLFAPDISKPGPEIQRAIMQARAKLAKSNLRIIHDVTMGIEEVIEEARRIKARFGSCALLLDYIQIAPDPKGKRRDTNREQDVAKNSMMLRNASKELEMPTIVLSQLNKDGTTRESSSIEMDADDVYRIEKEEGIFIHKQRNGEQEIYLPIFLNGQFFRFEQQI